MLFVNRFVQLFVVVSFIAASHVTAQADILYVKDGSRLSGDITKMTETSIVIETSFAGEISVPLLSLDGVTSETVQMVALKSGDRINARPHYDPDTGIQHLLQTSFGDLTVAADQLLGVRKDGDPSPETISLEKQLAAYQQKVKAYDDAWSGSIALGTTGATGNTKNLGIRGRAEAKRDIGRDRQLVYAEGRMQENDDILTAKEIFLGISAEHDLTDRWFVYAREDLEHDEFESLDLRSITGAGFGYWWIREKDHEFKPRFGLGYEFEAFENGENNREGVLALGYDYMIKMNDWYRFTHNLTIYPSFTDPGSDFRVDSRMGVEFPLASSDNWGFRIGLRNQYNNVAPANTKKLDTAYTADVVWRID